MKMRTGNHMNVPTNSKGRVGLHVSALRSFVSDLAIRHDVHLAPQCVDQMFQNLRADGGALLISSTHILYRATVGLCEMQSQVCALQRAVHMVHASRVLRQKQIVGCRHRSSCNEVLQDCHHVQVQASRSVCVSRRLYNLE